MAGIHGGGQGLNAGGSLRGDRRVEPTKTLPSDFETRSPEDKTIVLQNHFKYLLFEKTKTGMFGVGDLTSSVVNKVRDAFSRCSDQELFKAAWRDVVGSNVARTPAIQSAIEQINGFLAQQTTPSVGPRHAPTVSAASLGFHRTSSSKLPDEFSGMSSGDQAKALKDLFRGMLIDLFDEGPGKTQTHGSEAKTRLALNRLKNAYEVTANKDMYKQQLAAFVRTHIKLIPEPGKNLVKNDLSPWIRGREAEDAMLLRELESMDTPDQREELTWTREKVVDHLHTIFQSVEHETDSTDIFAAMSHTNTTEHLALTRGAEIHDLFVNCGDATLFVRAFKEFSDSQKVDAKVPEHIRAAYTAFCELRDIS